jgi:hypothetical protein
MPFLQRRRLDGDLGAEPSDPRAKVRGSKPGAPPCTCRRSAKASIELTDAEGVARQAARAEPSARAARGGSVTHRIDRTP